MSKIIIEINTDNASFDDCENEITNVLRRLAERFENGQEPSKVMDSNGNAVGIIEYK